ncbi:MAG: hypothetical protein KatS3mg102_0568 [Planctomycetota bacterium]|nr:MAG: hypothetical protein KatS3mg102_0568 [Planctomycetota bacterium]
MRRPSCRAGLRTAGRGRCEAVAPGGPARSAPAGIALVMVLLVLAALVVVGVPFARQMRLQERSARSFAAQRQAEWLAQGARELGLAWLLRSHPDQERRTAQAQGALGNSPEDWDDTAELRPQLEDLPGAETLAIADPRGTMLQVRVEDEDGKLDLDSTPPRALMNLLGVTVLLEPADEQSSALVLEDTSWLYSDGNPQTVDGLLRIDGELIAYRHLDGNRVLGLERGALFSGVRPQQLRHRAGALVHDARGYKLALHPFWLRPGHWSPFATVEAAREIARWRLAVPQYAWLRRALERRGYSPAELRALGLGAEALAALGVSAAGAGWPAPGPLEEEQAVAGGGAGAPAGAPPEGAAEQPEEAVAEDGPAPQQGGASLRELDPARLAERLRGEGAREQLPPLVERALGELGREQGAQWVERLAAELLGDARTQQLAELLRERVRQLAAYEEGYLRSQAEQVHRLAAVHDIEVLGARELERLRPYLTVWAARPVQWAGGALVRNRLAPDPRQMVSTLLLGVVVPEATIGAAARVEGPDGRVEYRRVVGYQRQRGLLQLEPPLEHTYEPEQARVWVRPPAPLNVNTAPRAVLRASLIGLGGLGPGEADALVARLVQAPLQDPGALGAVLGAALAAGELSPEQALAIQASAIDPGGRLARGQGVPFAYRSGDVYTLLATGIVNDPAGGELARRSVRDVVAVAPPREAVWHLDSQDDLTAAVPAPLGARSSRGRVPRALAWLLRPGRRGYLMETLPVPAESLRTAVAGSTVWLDRSHEPGRGELRLATGQTGEDTGGRGRVEHFRLEPEGHRLEGGMSLGAAEVPHMDDWFGTWPTETLAPGLVELWVRPEADASFTVFDLGQRDQTDRLVLRYDAAAGELVLEAWDAALPTLRPDGSPYPCARVRAPWRPEPGVWYHLAASWRGTRPGDLALFVDGLLAGRAGPPDGLARLTAPLGPEDTAIRVDGTDGFPEQGALLVGTEVVEYDARTADAFRVVDRRSPQQMQPDPQGRVPPPTGRGARGTQPRPHAAGTPVRLWGYTNFFVTGIPGVIEVLPVRRGGARLLHALPAEVPCTTLMPPGGEGDLLRNDASTIPTAPAGPTLASLGFPPRGFLQIKHEVLYYDRLGAHSFEGCVRRVYGWFDNEVLRDPRTGEPIAEGYAAFTPIFLASIELTDASDYEDFELPGGLVPQSRNPLRGFWCAIGGEWFRYFKAANIPNPTTGQPDPRWRNILICADAPADLASTQPAAFGGGSHAVRPDRDRWGRADGWQRGGAAKYQQLLERLERNQGGPFPTAPVDRRPDHIHYGMEWARNLWSPDGSARAHPAASPVLPVYALTRPYTGAGDRLTLLDGNPAARPRRAQLEVARGERAHLLSAATGNRPLPFWLAAFTEWIPARPWDPGQGLRLVKRPSGQLPLFGPFAMRIGAPRPAGETPPADGGVLAGRIDELRVATDRTNRDFDYQAALRAAAQSARLAGGRPRVLLPEPLPPVGGGFLHQAQFGVLVLTDPVAPPEPFGIAPGARRVPLEPVWHDPADRLVNSSGIVVLAGNEAIGLGRFAGGWLEDMTRGMLGTQPEMHSEETPLYPLPFPPVARLAGGFDGARGERIPLSRGRESSYYPDAEAFAERGMLMLDAGEGGGVEEILPYEERQRNYLLRPRDDRGRGVYRGAFGTSQQAELREGRLVFAFPFRHHDRFQTGVESDDGCFFQAGWSPPGAGSGVPALFTRVSWDERPGRADADVWVLVRIDGRPAWDAEPTNAPGGLWRFDDPRAPNRIEVSGHTIEVRVVMPFKPGAYARGAWKDSPVVDAIRVYYVQPTRVLASEQAR